MRSHLEIYQDVKQRILNGKLMPGTMLPTHRRLCQEHSVSVGTITKAINRLKKEGYVQSQRGSGTMVKDLSEKTQNIARNTVVVVTAGHILTHNLLAYAAQEVFFGTNWVLANRCAYGNLDWYKDALRDSHENPPTGMILNAMAPQEFCYEQSLLPSPDTKVVIIGHEIPGRTYDRVCASAYWEGHLLSEYILRKEHKSVLYVTTSPLGLPLESDTLRGLAESLSRNGVPFDESHIRRYQDTHSYGLKPDPVIDGYQYIRELLKRERPGVIVAGHDWIAVAAVRAIQDSGLTLPDDVAVISAEGAEYIGRITGTPKLTSFDTLFYLRAKIAADILKQRLEGDDGPVRVHEVLGHVVEGQTG